MGNPYVPEPWEKIEGPHDVIFRSEHPTAPTLIDVKVNVITSNGIPLYLVSKDDTIYNWMNIISIKKVDI